MSTIIASGGEVGDSFEDLKRIEEQYRRLGIRTPVCAWPGCGERNPFSLIGRHPDISCYEHVLLRTGKRPYEFNHAAGQHNSDVAAEVPGNDHRVLSELQRLWPEDTLRNPEHSPLLVQAAAIRGWSDVQLVIIHRSLDGIPEFLERLHLTLVDQYGPEWWTKLGLARDL